MVQDPPDQAVNDDVSAALNLLRDALGEEELRIRAEGANAMNQGRYDTATAVIDFAKRLLAFQDRVGDLQNEWAELETLRDSATPEVQEIVSKRFFGRKKKGQITPHHEYCRAILEALVEMGGSARCAKVLDRVGEKMKDALKPIDHEPLPSNRNQLRWRNSAQWARNMMVNGEEDARMKQGSKTGTWEISEAGRVWLKKNG